MDAGRRLHRVRNRRVTLHLAQGEGPTESMVQEPECDRSRGSGPIAMGKRTAKRRT